MKYRKIPVEVDAIQWTGNNYHEVCEFMKTAQFRADEFLYIYINTLEGQMCASVGDYIIKGVKGEFYPCKPDIFEKTYEKVEDL